MAIKKSNKLSTAQKNKIYKLYKEHHFTKKELAAEFNCSFTIVKALIANFDSPVHLQRMQANKTGLQAPVKYANENWKLVTYPTRTKYEVSNLGRVRSYFPDPAKPVISNGILQMGYIFLDYFNTRQQRRIKVPLHILVADHFISKASPLHSRVIHLDYKKANNRAANLKWVTPAEFTAHQNQNPAVKIARTQIDAMRTQGAKLTLIQVERIRKMLRDPARKITKQRIAAMYNIEPMTVYRIQSGEIWGNKGNHTPYQKKQIVRLADDTIKEIKKKLEDRVTVQAAIAREYGVSPTVISRIKKGLTYKAV